MAPATNPTVEIVACENAFCPSWAPCDEQALGLLPHSFWKALLYVDLLTTPKTPPMTSPTTPAPPTISPIRRCVLPSDGVAAAGDRPPSSPDVDEAPRMISTRRSFSASR